MKLRNVLIILLLVVVAGFASSCRKKKIYLLTGKLPISCDGCKVFISPATFYFLPECMPVDQILLIFLKFRCIQPLANLHLTAVLFDTALHL